MKMKVTSGSLHIGLKTRPNYADASIFYQKKKTQKNTHTYLWLNQITQFPPSFSLSCMPVEHNNTERRDFKATAISP